MSFKEKDQSFSFLAKVFANLLGFKPLRRLAPKPLIFELPTLPTV